MINSPARHIALDTETTGFGPKTNKIIEIGAIEFDPETGLLTGKRFYTRLNPNMAINPMATKVHGMTLNDLKDEPSFGHVANDFLKFIQGGHLVIHNAPFDVSFLDEELARINAKPLANDIVGITDTLKLAKGHLNLPNHNLDSLADHFGIDRSNREKHGALVDCEILAQIYPHVRRAVLENAAKVEAKKTLNPQVLAEQEKDAKVVIGQITQVKAQVQDLVPFTFGDDVDAMGLEMAAARQMILAGIASMIDKEQKRYTERVRTIADNQSFSSDVCGVFFTERKSVNWEAIVKEKFPDLDTKPYEKKIFVMKIMPSANAIVAEASQSAEIKTASKSNRP